MPVPPTSWCAETHPTPLFAVEAVRTRAGPFRLDEAAGDVPVDGGMRPVRRPADQPVLHRVQPAIPHMRREFGLVPDMVGFAAGASPVRH